MFDSSWIFDADQLDCVLLGIDAERVKGVFITDRGKLAYNMADHVLTKSPLRESPDSRVEIISPSQRSFVGVEEALLGCVHSR
ncbi:MAG: hypothetical protein AAF628_21880 [Planctomycetota bacterium]